MSAAVVADVDDQCIAVAFGAEIPMELGEPRRHHVGQVQVANATARLLVHPRAVALDPFTVARGNLVRQRLHVERAFTVTWSNPANGKSISSVLGGPVVNEFAPDDTQTQTVAGRERLFIARGEGPIAKQVGRIVFVVAPDGTETIPFVAGQWDLDITPELCAYLA